MYKEGKGDALERVSGIRGLWSDMCRFLHVERSSSKATEGRESGPGMLSEPERALAIAFTPEQRAAYEHAQRNSCAAIEQIREDGERRAEEIFAKRQEESLRKLMFAASTLAE